MGSLKLLSGLVKHIDIVILKECTKFRVGIIKAIFKYISFIKSIKKYTTKTILLKAR
jgi:hypothetical protein